MGRTFILSTGRTGTLYLAQALDKANPGLSAMHETPGSRALNVLAGMVLSGLPVGGMLNRHWRRVFSSKPDTFVESNNMVWAALAMSSDLRRTDRVVQVIRDPRTYVVSHGRLAKMRWKSAMANWTPFWQPGSSILENFFSNGSFRRYCIAWKTKNEYIRERYRECSYYCLRYEDIFSGDSAVRNATWRDLAAFTGLNIPENPGLKTDRVNSTSGGAHWDSWPWEKMSILEDICGELAREYGYCNESAWTTKLGIRS